MHEVEAMALLLRPWVRVEMHEVEAMALLLRPWVWALGT